MFNRALPRWVAAVAVACLGATLAVGASRAAENACDPLLSGERVLQQFVQPMQGRVRATIALPASEPGTMIVLVRERGIDVMVEFEDESGKLVQRADNPLSRAGVQRLVITTPAPARFNVALFGKEHDQVAGEVTLSVVPISTDRSSSRCVAIFRQLAAADSHYAAGQAANLALTPLGTEDAPTSYRSAANAYLAAVNLAEQSGASALMARSQLELATTYYEGARDWQNARSWSASAIAGLRAPDEEHLLALAHALHAAATMEVAVTSPSGGSASAPAEHTVQLLAEARRELTQAANVHARRGEHFEQALALNNIGLAFYYEGRYEDSIQGYERALVVYRSLHEPTRHAQTLQNVALVQHELGRYEAAITRYHDALGQLPKGGELQLRGMMLNNSALANLGAGHFDAALDQYAQGLTLLERAQIPREQARSLNGIGAVYLAVGNPSLALEFFNQALPFRPAKLDSRGRAASLRAAATTQRQLGRADLALSLHREALTLATAPDARRRILIQIAKDLAALSRPDEARAVLDEILSDAANIDPVDRALVQLEQGRLLSRAGDATGAAKEFREAAAVFARYESAPQEIDALTELARIYRSSSDARALATIDRAVRLTEEVRTFSANPELRASLLQPLRSVFDLKIDILADRWRENARAGRAEEAQRAAEDAFTASEQARARALVDYLDLDKLAAGDQRVRELLGKQRGLYGELGARRAQLETRQDRSGVDDARAVAMRAEIVRLKHEIDVLNSEVASLSWAGTVATRLPGKADLTRIPNSVAVVEYALTSSGAYAWIASRTGLRLVELSSAAEIDRAAREVHRTFSEFASVPLAERLHASSSLARLILDPLALDAATYHTIVFIPDGALHYVPLAALLMTPAKAAPRFLVAEMDVAVAPALHVLLAGADRHEEPAGTRMLLVADPVYESTDPRFSKAKLDAPAREATGVLKLLGARDLPRQPRLPGSGAEARAIASLLPASEVDQLVGFGATREGILRRDLAGYRYLHFAVHGSTDAEYPQLSSLVLSRFDAERRPIAADIRASDFSAIHLHADAVVMSACDTALGKEVIGEGLVGLRYVMLARGARAVVASHWKVPDEPTAELMQSLYSALLRDGQSPVRALSRAMNQMSSGDFNDPAWWGEFSVAISRFEAARRPGT